MAAEEAEVSSELQRRPEAGLTTPSRQCSIYSRTLDEIQNTACEPGKKFGSMNMDEFLTNLWKAEDGLVAAGAVTAPPPSTIGSTSLNQRGPLSIPSPLRRKTVDEVWEEIHGEQKNGRRIQQLQQQQSLGYQKHGNVATIRQPTLGKMTLEDFLIKAGVVREEYNPAMPSPLLAVVPPPQHGMAPAYNHVYGEAVTENGRSGDLYRFSGDNGGSGAAGRLQLGMAGTPVSPMSSDGMDCSGGVPLDGYVLGMDGVGGTNAGGGRKRMSDGAVEVVVERRQRRMIKNRESAARSRARKQAYTVELEAELNELKEENFRLREEERRGSQIRRQMFLDALAKRPRPKTEKEKGSLRRSSSSPS